MYYLQSRYYNPEWGRFINADAMAGRVGELLGHNLFSYTKNNPVNRQDPSGFMSFNTSDGFGECDNPPPDLSWSPSGAIAVAVSTALKAAEDNLNGVLDHVVVGTRMITTRYTGTIPLPATLGVETLGMAGKVAGIVGIFLSANSMRSDLLNNNYTSTQRWLRFGIDATGTVAAALLFSSGGWVAIGGTIVLTGAVELGKYAVDFYFRKND